MRGSHYWLQGRRVGLSLATRYYIVDRALRRITDPTLTDVLRNSSYAATDATELLGRVFSVMDVEVDFNGLKCEYVVVRERLRSRYELVGKLPLAYPINWAVEEQSSLLLYCLVRALKPRIVVETGVANGHSSFVLLNALKANGRGKLVSIDICNDVGRLVSAEEAEGWEVRLLSRPGAAKQLRAILESAAPVDVFIHDSNHLHGWQMTEYRAAAAVLSHDGILISDDVNSSYAFWDFCNDRDLRPAILFDDRKALGVACRRRPM